MPDIRSIHFNAQTRTAEENIPELLAKPRALDAMLDLPDDARSLESTASEISMADRQAAEWSSETAARYHLQTLLANQDSERLYEMTSPDRPALVPDMRLERDRELTVAGSRNVSFIQTSRSIPIFGT